MKLIHTGILTGKVSIGKAFIYRKDSVAVDGEGMGLSEFRRALDEVRNDLAILSRNDEIFAAHMEMAEDPFLEEQVTAFIEEGKNAIDAVKMSLEAIKTMFLEIDDEYLRSRTDDVADVCGRIIDKITGKVNVNPFETLEKKSIIVAENLVPSDTALMDFSLIEGLITASGNRTSHVCIIAGSKGIQAVAGIGSGMEHISDGDSLIIDGIEGKIIVNPDKEVEERFLSLKCRCDEEYVDENDSCLEWSGEKIAILGNAGSISDVREAINQGAEGIGLFRSEFLYLESKDDFPDEYSQTKAYIEAASICGERPLTIRTLDIGGDKSLPYLHMEKEENPFLGWRAIRMSLEMRDVFKTQIRAILRASTSGNVRIMFPMITTEEDFTDALSIVKECMNELEAEGIGFNRDIPVGMMIETPASVIMAAEFAQKADFFSIGTNDLTQYMMAADRGNAKVTKYYDTGSPAVTKAIAAAVRAGRDAGIEVGMCGEYAAETDATEKLLDIGLREFSVSAMSVKRLHRQIRSLMNVPVILDVPQSAD